MHQKQSILEKREEKSEGTLLHIKSVNLLSLEKLLQRKQTGLDMKLPCGLQKESTLLL